MSRRRQSLPFGLVLLLLAGAVHGQDVEALRASGNLEEAVEKGAADESPAAAYLEALVELGEAARALEVASVDGRPDLDFARALALRATGRYAEAALLLETVDSSRSGDALDGAWRLRARDRGRLRADLAATQKMLYDSLIRRLQPARHGPERTDELHRRRQGLPLARSGKIRSSSRTPCKRLRRGRCPADPGTDRSASGPDRRAVSREVRLDSGSRVALAPVLAQRARRASARTAGDGAGAALRGQSPEAMALVEQGAGNRAGARSLRSVFQGQPAARAGRRRRCPGDCSRRILERNPPREISRRRLVPRGCAFSSRA